MIVGYKWQILGRLFAPPPIREQPWKGSSWLGLNKCFNVLITEAFAKGKKNYYRNTFCQSFYNVLSDSSLKNGATFFKFSRMWLIILPTQIKPRKSRVFIIRIFSNINLCWLRLVFSRFLDLNRNLGNVKEKPTRKTCFSCERKRLAPRVYQAKFYLPAILGSQRNLCCVFMRNRY